MIFDVDTARATARHLLQIKAIKLQPQDPFTWASGWKSPIYCDNRISLSFPVVRNFLREKLSQAIQHEFGTPDCIAGVATGAIAMGALVAQEMALPYVYVRPEPKSHGRQNQIEGHLEPGCNVVVVEDLVSTGGSSLKAVKALRQAEAKVAGMAAFFTYGFELAEKNFSEAGCRLVTLCDYEQLLSEARESGFIDEENLDTLRQWRLNPQNWQPDSQPSTS